jgi:hypothetical protein
MSQTSMVQRFTLFANLKVDTVYTCNLSAKSEAIKHLVICFLGNNYRIKDITSTFEPIGGFG